MIVKFRIFLSTLDYDCLKAEMDYLKDNYNVNYTLKFDTLVIDKADDDILELIKDTLKLSYGEYLNRYK